MLLFLMLEHLGISDPGEVIAKKAIEEGIEVIPIPGACAAISALIASGLDTKEFVFLGFLPLNKKLRKEKLEEIESEFRTIIIYEAPHKLKETLKDLSDIIADRQIVLARELTKIHEEFIRGNISEIINKSENLKGEMIILIEGAQKEKKEIIKKIAKDRGVNKNEIYKEFV